MTIKPVHVVGGGLAGSEAAWQIASAGVPVILHEMRPVRETPAHKTDGLAELVCSNSFRSDDAETNAVGVLHAEMRLAGSLVMSAGDANQVPANKAANLLLLPIVGRPNDTRRTSSPGGCCSFRAMLAPAPGPLAAHTRIAFRLGRD